MKYLLTMYGTDGISLVNALVYYVAIFVTPLKQLTSM